MKTLLVLFYFAVSIHASDLMNPTSKCVQEALKKCKTLACAYIEKNKAQIQEIKADDLLKRIETGDKNFILVDIRGKEQHERGQIDYENQVNIDRGHLEMEIENEVKNKDAEIILYCCTGRRSTISAKTLNDMGYSNVKSLNGGLIDWVDSGKPLMTNYGIVRIMKAK